MPICTKIFYIYIKQPYIHTNENLHNNVGTIHNILNLLF